MSHTRFLIIGAGGVGSHLTEPLARMLEYSDIENPAIIIVDGDHYEPKNKERQTFSEIGSKAQVLANDIAKKFESTLLVPLAKWVVATPEEEGDEDPEDVDEFGNPNAGKIAASSLLMSGDIVYAVVDNFACRRILLDAAAELENVDVFLAGNDEDMFGTVYHYRRRDGVDITNNPAVFKDEFANPTDRNPGELSCQERAEIEGGTQLIAANFAVAAMLIGRTQATIIEESEGDTALEASELYFDIRVGRMLPHDRRTSVVIEEAVEIREPVVEEIVEDTELAAAK
jgi:molybdopterin/thiamine biosynthesis adenylyltransferase